MARIEVCPPETISTMLCAGSGPCSRMSAAAWPARWWTPYRGTPRDQATDLAAARPTCTAVARPGPEVAATRSEEHTSELQSRGHLVCRLLLEKKNKRKSTHSSTRKQ